MYDNVGLVFFECEFFRDYLVVLLGFDFLVIVFSVSFLYYYIDSKNLWVSLGFFYKDFI